jgi:hypothetical protein
VGAAQATAWVKERLETYELTVEEQRFTASVPGRGEVEFVNLVARPTRSDTVRSAAAIVVMADRDNLGMSPGLDDNASGTAALIELARDFSTVSLAHEILFVSTDGGSYGGIGTTNLAEDERFRGSVLAVVNLDAIGGAGPARLAIAGDTANSPSSALIATADASVLQETGRRARHPNAFFQLLDLAFPFTLYGQGPFLASGVSAITLTAAGDRPPTPAEDIAAAFVPERLGAIGRAAHVLVSSLDRAAEVASDTQSSLYLGGRLVRGFAIQLLLVVCLIPALVATADLFARLRRRGLALAPALRSYRSRLLVWLWAGGLAALFTAAGAFPTGAPRALSPETATAQEWPFAAIAGLIILAGAGWFVARARLVPRGVVDRGEELAGHLAAMLALCALGIALVFLNTFALLLLLPSLHAWLFAPHVRDRSAWLRVAVFALGLLGPVALVATYAVRLELGFDAPWYLAALFTVRYAPVSLFLVLLAWGAAAGQIGSILFGRYSPYPSEGTSPERGLVREGVRQTVLLARRRRRARPRRAEGWSRPDAIQRTEHDVLPR